TVLIVPEVIVPIPEIVAHEHAVSTGSPSSTTVDQDAPSPSNSHTIQETQNPISSHDAEEESHDIEVAHMGNDPYFGILIPEVPSDQSLSSDVIHTIVPSVNQSMQRNFMNLKVLKFGRVPPTDKHLSSLYVDLQIVGIDFEESFAPVARLEAIPKEICLNLVDPLDTPMVLLIPTCPKQQGGRSRGILNSVIGLLLRFQVICVLRISGPYTSRLLDAACKKSSESTQEKIAVEATLKSAWAEKDQIDNLLKERRTSDVNYLQRKMEILLEPNINKIMVDPHRFEGNLKMVVNGNLFPADSQRSIATMLLPGQRWWWRSRKFTRWQSFKMAKRLCLVDDLKMLKITMSNTSSRNKLNPEINDHYNIFTGECQKDELKTQDKALYARLKDL
ncbi:hypothetical protein Tco_0603917, partial [Tanacetum coccineum]